MDIQTQHFESGGRARSFIEDLRSLCLHHKIALCPTIDGQIGVWDAVGRESNVYDLVDCTSVPKVLGRGSLGAVCFINAASANFFPGCVAQASTEQKAAAVAAGLSEAEIVPIGGLKGRRTWAVIQRPT